MLMLLACGGEMRAGAALEGSAAGTPYLITEGGVSCWNASWTFGDNQTFTCMWRCRSHAGEMGDVFITFAKNPAWAIQGTIVLPHQGSCP
jgi:hypothetical protein